MTTTELEAIRDVNEKELGANLTPRLEEECTPTSESLISLGMDIYIYIYNILEEVSNTFEESVIPLEEHTSVAAKSTTPYITHTDDARSHVPMISHTHPNDKTYPPLDQELDDLFGGCANGLNFDDMASHISPQYDDKNMSLELVVIVVHIYLSTCLELLVEYTNGGTFWHHIEPIKDDNPYAIAEYVKCNDIGMHSNGKYYCGYMHMCAHSDVY